MIEFSPKDGSLNQSSAHGTKYLSEFYSFPLKQF
jgi:hypothetical protein